MTRRKPPGMSFESWIDRQIREARERGEFDDLPGTGRPLAGEGGAYDPDWWVKRWIRREKLSVLPPALELRARVEGELEQALRLPSEAGLRRRVEALNARIRAHNARATSGPPTSLSPLDVEAIVRRHRARRRGGDREGGGPAG